MVNTPKEDSTKAPAETPATPPAVPAATPASNDDDAAQTAQENAAPRAEKEKPAAEEKKDYSMMSSKDLRSLCESFEAAIRPMQDQISALKGQIMAAEEREHREKCEAQVRELVPGDKAVLGAHKFIFMINNSKEGGQDQGGFLTAAVQSAFAVSRRISFANAKKETLNASFWGIYGELRLDPRFNGTDFNTDNKESHNFLPAAKKILDMSTPDNVDGKKQNYVIICEGKLDDNAAQATAILEAAAHLNPAATFDFIVCNAAETAVDKLAKDFGATASGKNVNLIKVAAPQDIAPAVIAALKARMEGKAHTPPAPVAPPARPANTTNNPSL